MRPKFTLLAMSSILKATSWWLPKSHHLGLPCRKICGVQQSALGRWVPLEVDALGGGCLHPPGAVGQDGTGHHGVGWGLAATEPLVGASWLAQPFSKSKRNAKQQLPKLPPTLPALNS